MQPHTRAMIAAAAYAYLSGQKVAGIHDHSSGRDLQVAAEARGGQLQGYDGDRRAQFGGALPELFDAGEQAFVSFEINGAKASGYDRKSAHAWSAQVSELRVQLYDYGPGAWFTFDIQVA